MPEQPPHIIRELTVSFERFRLAAQRCMIAEPVVEIFGQCTSIAFPRDPLASWYPPSAAPIALGP
jgi:hypothetical protein